MAEVTHAEKPEKWFSASDARQAAQQEREMGVWEAIKANKRAVGWSVAISMAIVMEGYDTSLVPSFFGYPAFVKNYGNYYPELDQYQMTGAWQAGLTNSPTVGVIMGGFLNGWASARFGYKRTMLVSLFMLNAFIFVPFFSRSPTVLSVGEILCGIPWGVFATTGPAYASECCPLALRGYLTVFANLCWAIGQLIANGVLRGLVNRDDEWAYRIPFAIQWIWPLPLFLIILFAPESPWWLLKQDRATDAEKSLRRLSDKTDEEIRGTMSQMMHTIRLEQEMESGTSFWDCFKGVDLRRTEICCMTFSGQMLSGAQFAYGPSYFFLQAGMSTDDAYMVGVGSTALAFVGTILSWFLLTYFGRRTIYLSGIAALATTLLLIGIISASTNSEAGIWAQASLCLIWQLFYSLTVGPIGYAIISETSAIRLRAKSVVLSRNTYNVVSVISAVLEPYMMNPTEWNWKGKTAFFWSGSALLMTVWTYFRLPECRGRTYAELDLLFARKVSARKFSSTHVDAFEDTENVQDVVTAEKL
ncbi:general substrate transporter [Thozetella sp. PMI_491]|nr:general substrate transporter [Thozetella sp. PMI_491]